MCSCFTGSHNKFLIPKDENRRICFSLENRQFLNHRKRYRLLHRNPLVDSISYRGHSGLMSPETVHGHS